MVRRRRGNRAANAPAFLANDVAALEDHGQEAGDDTQEMKKTKGRRSWINDLKPACFYAAVCLLAILSIPAGVVVEGISSRSKEPGRRHCINLWRHMELALPLALALPSMVAASSAQVAADTRIHDGMLRSHDDSANIASDSLDALDGGTTAEASQQYSNDDDDEFHLNPFAAPVDPNAKRDHATYPKHKVPPAPMRDTDLSTGPGGLILLIFPAIAYGIYYIRKPAAKPQRTSRNVPPVATSRIAERLAAVAEAHRSFRSTLSSFTSPSSSSAVEGSTTSSQHLAIPPNTSKLSKNPITFELPDSPSPKKVISSNATQTDSSPIPSSSSANTRHGMRRRSRQLRPQPSFVSARSSFEEGGYAGQSPALSPSSRFIEDLEEENELVLPEAIRIPSKAVVEETPVKAVLQASDPATSSSIPPLGSVGKKNPLSSMFRRMITRNPSGGSHAAEASTEAIGVVSQTVGTIPDSFTQSGVVDKKAASAEKATAKGKGKKKALKAPAQPTSVATDTRTSALDPKVEASQSGSEENNTRHLEESASTVSGSQLQKGRFWGIKSSGSVNSLPTVVIADASETQNAASEAQSVELQGKLTSPTPTTSK
ncbi:hypothetical protein HDU67_003209, partial [Dinochytrium kinnereticum]